MATPAGPKPVGPGLELRLPLRLQRVDRRRLQQRSTITGIPSARRPLALGMNTRRTGIGVHEPWWCCTQSARLALSSGVSATCPSTPAVRRPALTSVTRRTPARVFARDRSINFWRLRTLFRSPALDAVKIRCRSRRTSSSTARQSTASQSRAASSGPFTTTPTGPAVSNLSIGSDLYFIASSTGSPDPRQRPFRPRHHACIRPVMRHHQRRNWSTVPVSCRLSTYRHSLLGSSFAR